jgi:thiamine biosynthesis protein ThiI
MLEKLVIVRYGEIGVKSPKVRGRFERKLIENIKTVINDPVDLKQGRIYIYPQDIPKALGALEKIYWKSSHGKTSQTVLAPASFIPSSAAAYFAASNSRQVAGLG